MATRFYVVSNVDAGYEPAFSGSWDITTGAVRKWLEKSPTVAATTTQTWQGTKNIAGPCNVLIAQFILPWLEAQTISGNLKGQALMNEANGLTDAGVQTVARIWRPSTTAFVGTLLAANNYGAISATPGNVGYELATTMTNRKIPSGWSGSGTALTSQTAEAGDCLVIEVGCRCFEGAATSRVLQLRGLSNAGTDLAEDETTTTSNNPWFEFSGTITQRLEAPVLDWSPLEIGDSAVGALTAGQLWPRGAGQ